METENNHGNDRTQARTMAMLPVEAVLGLLGQIARLLDDPEDTPFLRDYGRTLYVQALLEAIARIGGEAVADEERELVEAARRLRAEAAADPDVDVTPQTRANNERAGR